MDRGDCNALIGLGEGAFNDPGSGRQRNFSPVRALQTHNGQIQGKVDVAFEMSY